MNLFMSGVIGGCVGLVAYGVLFALFDSVSGWWDEYDDRKKKISWWVKVAFVFIFSTLGTFYVPGWLDTFQKNAEAKQAAYEASLRKVTVVVTDVESVPNVHNVLELVGVLILTEEYPRHKIFIPFRNDGLKHVTVGDMLDLKLDGWNVIEAAPAETMPIPHAK